MRRSDMRIARSDDLEVSGVSEEIFREIITGATRHIISPTHLGALRAGASCSCPTHPADKDGSGSEGRISHSKNY